MRVASTNRHSLKSNWDTTPFCWFRHLERVSFLIKGGQMYKVGYFITGVIALLMVIVFVMSLARGKTDVLASVGFVGAIFIGLAIFFHSKQDNGNGEQ